MNAALIATFLVLLLPKDAASAWRVTPDFGAGTLIIAGANILLFAYRCKMRQQVDQTSPERYKFVILPSLEKPHLKAHFLEDGD
ncbi:hypothetical protein [Rhizobium skierniewicense]|uniref:hypothetical protein n=1 Tax=Rhizobium skierniewicense TaxID=984260 RepID=UPI0015737222|nr:hypothetical protein [Rhizobium skierniewicense]NTF30476.1 hypothetical protein [Rhizobium skierniewicense]